MRCIDADALKEKAWDADTRCGYVQVVDVGDIDDAPTIEPERKTWNWIHVTKRLPEIGEEVLLSEPNATFIAEYHGSGNAEGLWVVSDRHHYLADVNKCAWMPLPKRMRNK